MTNGLPVDIATIVVQPNAAHKAGYFINGGVQFNTTPLTHFPTAPCIVVVLATS